jgi:hypothetical protein
MNSVFPYCDQHDCKHYDTCQSEPRITFRVLSQTPESVELHNACRNTVQKSWDNYMLDVAGEWLNKRNRNEL